MILSGILSARAILTVLLINIFLNGCLNIGGKYGESYYCISIDTCTLPEPIVDGKALVYLIRPVSLFNSAEIHKISLSSLSDDSVMYAEISGSEYCIFYPSPGKIILHSEGGGGVGDSLKLQVKANEVYYVRHSVVTPTFTGKVGANLSRINHQEAKNLLEAVAGKCYQQRK